MPPTRLSALDASFLAVETPTAHMHVGWAASFSPPDEGEAPTFEELRDHVGRRLPAAPRYRQRLKRVPLGLSPPVWVDDERFDLSRHVLPASSDRLEEIVSECMSAPLPRGQPLWQMRIGDLADGRLGVVGKAHHCMVDGIAAVELASLMLDPEPEARPQEPDQWTPKPAPDGRSLLLQGVLDGVRRRAAFAADAARALRDPFDLAGRARATASAVVDSLRPAAAVEALNRPISPVRQLGRVRRPLGELKRIKETFGTTVNDVLLATSAGAMRRYQRRRDRGPVPLKTMVPVNARGAGDGEAPGNRLAYMFVDLPCDEPDPVRRLRLVHAATAERKRTGVAEGSEALLSIAEQAPYPLHAAISRFVASPRAFNLVVSNIPGPAAPLYMRGCLLEEAYPVVPLADRHSISIGMTTVRDEACFGLYVDPRSMPDLAVVVDDLEASFEELLARSDDRPPLTEPLVSVPG